MDQDIWQDYDLSDFEELPKWIIDPTVKDGIPLAQSIWSCCSEKKRCIAEQWNLCQWIHIEICVTNALYTTSLPEDLDVAFHALLKLHELAVLLEMCRTTLMSLGITTDQLQWPDFMPPAHIEDFPFLKEVKDHVQSGLEPDVHQEGGQMPSDISQDVNDTVSLDDDDDEGMLEEAVKAWLSELDDD